jgi:hypothetical protein
MDPIRWDDDPSFPPNLPVQVHSPRPGNNSFLRLLGPHVGAFVHCVKDGRRRRPAACLRTDCPHCKKQEADWKAYIPALLWRARVQPNWLHVVGEFTQVAFDELTKEVSPKEFRGKVVEVSRGQTNSRMHARLVESPQKDLGILPPTFDVKIVLRRLWGYAKPTPRAEGEFDPTPPPAIEPVHLPAPLPEPEAPPAERINFKQLREQHANGKGGGK